MHVDKNAATKCQTDNHFGFSDVYSWFVFALRFKQQQTFNETEHS